MSEKFIPDGEKQGKCLSDMTSKLPFKMHGDLMKKPVNVDSSDEQSRSTSEKKDPSVEHATVQQKILDHVDQLEKAEMKKIGKDEAAHAQKDKAPAEAAPKLRNSKPAEELPEKTHALSDGQSQPEKKEEPQSSKQGEDEKKQVDFKDNKMQAKMVEQY